MVSTNREERRLTGTTDMTDLNFPSSVIAQEYLSCAAPETVYAWLNANAGEMTPLYSSPFPTELLTALLKRNDNIVNLGVASVAADREILKTLWQTNNETVRIAIAGNPYRDHGVFFRHTWAEDGELTSALQDSHPDFLKSWCTNPALHFDELKQAFLREGIYEKLSGDRWLAVIYWSLQNPKLITPSDRHHEGTDLPAYKAAWSLLLTLPNTRDNAYILCERYANLTKFFAPFETLLKEPLADYFSERERWQEQQNEGQLLFLKHVFEIWSSRASDDPKALDSEGKEIYYFQILRQGVAAAVANGGTEVRNFIKNHDDVYVRRGYYTAGRFTNATEINDTLQKDGRDFLEAAIYNKNLYPIYPKGLRVAFLQSVEDNPQSYDYPHPGFLRIWNHKATELFKEDPNRYPDPNSLDPDEPEPAAVQHEKEQQSELWRRLDRIEVIATGCALILIAGVALWAARGMEAAGRAWADSYFVGQGVGDLAGTLGFIATLIVVWQVASYVLFKKSRR